MDTVNRIFEMEPSLKLKFNLRDGDSKFCLRSKFKLRDGDFNLSGDRKSI